MANQNTQTSFDLAFNGYTIRLESAPGGGYIVSCLDTTEKQQIYSVLVCDLEKFFWAADEIKACIEAYENMLAETKTEHLSDVLFREQALAKKRIRGVLGAALAARPMLLE